MLEQPVDFAERGQNLPKDSIYIRLACISTGDLYDIVHITKHPITNIAQEMTTLGEGRSRPREEGIVGFGYLEGYFFSSVEGKSIQMVLLEIS